MRLIKLHGVNMFSNFIFDIFLMRLQFSVLAILCFFPLCLDCATNLLGILSRFSYILTSRQDQIITDPEISQNLFFLFTDGKCSSFWNCTLDVFKSRSMTREASATERLTNCWLRNRLELTEAAVLQFNHKYCFAPVDQGSYNVGRCARVCARACARVRTVA